MHLQCIILQSLYRDMFRQDSYIKVDFICKFLSLQFILLLIHISRWAKYVKYLTCCENYVWCVQKASKF
jgi:hypothetical protein